jgi:hypothetical protein
VLARTSYHARTLMHLGLFAGLAGLSISLAVLITQSLN